MLDNIITVRDKIWKRKIFGKTVQPSQFRISVGYYLDLSGFVPLPDTDANNPTFEIKSFTVTSLMKERVGQVYIIDSSSVRDQTYNYAGEVLSDPTEHEDGENFLC